LMCWALSAKFNLAFANKWSPIKGIIILNEQMKSIQKELGQAEDENEIEDLQASIKKAKMPNSILVSLLSPP
jgi:ATP-dependent Lon protease